MNLAGQIIGVILVIGGLVGAGVYFGHGSRDEEVENLELKVQAETLRADGQTATLRSLKAKLVEERIRRQQMQTTAEAELAALAGRVAALSRAAERFENDLRKKASNDEDCTALRAQPVCAAVADGLWGRQTTAGSH